MSRARFTQHDVSRALKGAKDAGVDVVIEITGATLRILPRLASSDHDDPDEAFRRWEEQERARETQRRA